MLIYLSKSTGWAKGEPARLLNQAAKATPNKNWVKKQHGFGIFHGHQAVVIWDASVVWILRPQEHREYGLQPPTHSGSRYTAYQLKEWRSLKFTPLAWPIPGTASQNHLNRCQLFWVRRAHVEKLRLARNARRRAAYALKKAASK